MGKTKPIALANTLELLELLSILYILEMSVTKVTVLNSSDVVIAISLYYTI